jgi:hypothetical protein
MNKKFHTINLGRQNPTLAKAALFNGAGFTHAEIEKPSFEKGKCYQIRAYNAIYEIRFVEQDHEVVYGEFWYKGQSGGYGKFYDAKLVKEIPQVPAKMIRGERYVAKLKGHYSEQTWIFDFNEWKGGYIYYLTFCDDMLGYSNKHGGCLVKESDVDFIVPERIWNEHYVK